MLTWEEFRSRTSFARDELIAHGEGRLIEDPPQGFASRLPLPPMLMLDRVTEIERRGSRGRIVGERDVSPEDWFFACHFLGDPVQPGCLGVDGVWQLIGFYCGWTGGLGAGRALGCGEIDFHGQIRPHDTIVRTEVDIRRLVDMPAKRAALAIGDAKVLLDGVEIYSIKQARVGLFQDIAYPNELIEASSNHGRLA